MTSAEILPAPAVPEEDWAKGRLVLPGGILENGHRCQAVRVRELSGADEERLADRRYRNPADRVSDFLAHLIVEVEGLERDVDAELVADMLTGDRDYLVLRLRQMTLGDEVLQVMRCPSPACGEKVDVEFLISEFPVARPETLVERYELLLSRPALPGDPGSDRVVVRLPTGRDQRAVAEIAADNPGRAQTRLLSRLVLRLGDAPGLDEAAARELPFVVRGEIAAHLRRLTPGPELKVEIQCPFCGADMTYPFDLQSFFFAEWSMNLDALYREVHYLAFHYHWPEPQILELPRRKRRRYLSLLLEELEKAA